PDDPHGARGPGARGAGDDRLAGGGGGQAGVPGSQRPARGAVRHLAARPGNRRPGHLDGVRVAGGRDHRGSAAVDRGAGAAGLRGGAGGGRAVGAGHGGPHPGRAPAGRRARVHLHQRGRGGGTGVPARGGPDLRLRGDARLAARGRPRRSGVVPAAGGGAVGRPGGGAGPHRPGGGAGGTGQRLRAHRPGQAAAGVAGVRQARVPQRADVHIDHFRHSPQLDDRGDVARRGGRRLAGPRPHLRGVDPGQGLSGGAGGRAALRRDRAGGQPRGRPAAGGARPALHPAGGVSMVRAQLLAAGRTPVGAVAAGLLLAFVVLAVVAPPLWQDAADRVDTAAMLQGPSSRHWLGTDALGRDVLLRVLVATRFSIGLALAATLISAVLGLVFGTLPTVLPRPAGRLVVAGINL